MTILLVLLIIASAGAVAFALVRGLHAFANMRPAELDKNGIPESLALQNKMMFARVKWQAITILLIVILLMFFKAG
jgi:Hypoxia induced protein conserved region